MEWINRLRWTNSRRKLQVQCFSTEISITIRIYHHICNPNKLLGTKDIIWDSEPWCLGTANRPNDRVMGVQRISQRKTLNTGARGENKANNNNKVTNFCSLECKRFCFQNNNTEWHFHLQELRSVRQPIWLLLQDSWVTSVFLRFCVASSTETGHEVSYTHSKLGRSPSPAIYLRDPEQHGMKDLVEACPGKWRQATWPQGAKVFSHRVAKKLRGGLGRYYGIMQLDVSWLKM